MRNLTGKEVCVDLKDIQGGVAFGNELFASQPGDMCTDTRVTFRRITKTSRSITTAKQVTLVKTSGVSTSRSWSGPSIESDPINNDRHAVLSFNLIDAIPASGDLFGWVKNLDAFIKNHNVGFDKKQVEADTDQARDYNCKIRFSSAAIINTLGAVTGKESDQEPAGHQCSDGTIFFRVSHLRSFSQMKLSL